MYSIHLVAAPKLFEADNYGDDFENNFDDYRWVSPYFRLYKDGYSIIKLTSTKGKIEYWINDNTRSKNTYSYIDETFCIYPNDNTYNISLCSSFSLYNNATKFEMDYINSFTLNEPSNEPTIEPTNETNVANIYHPSFMTLNLFLILILFHH